MSLAYTLKEAFSGFSRTKLATFGSIFTICIALLLLGLYYVLSINTSRLIQSIRDRVEMEAFCEEPISRQRIQELQQELRAIEGIKSVRYVSKEEAAKIFKEEFGEDITNVLDFNPLPPSFKIYLENDFKNSARANEVFQHIKALKGVDDVIYRKDLLEFLDRRIGIVHTIGLVLGIMLGISAIFLVSNTIRLAIYARRKIIQTMKLVGATRWFIRTPFLLEGMIQGLLGGILAAAIIYWIFDFASGWVTPDFREFFRVDLRLYVLLVAAGVLLGLMGSVISVRRFIGESVVS